MNASDRRDGASILRGVLAALLASGGSGEGQAGADLRRLVGDLSVAAPDRVEAGSFGPPLRACFRAATAAGATFDGMLRVQAVALASPDRAAVQRVAQTASRYALVEMASILSAATFTSRQDADAALARINAAFEPAEEYAADQGASDVQRALVALHAATARDLSQRSRQLPRLVTYTQARRLPAVTLANRLYGNGGRSDELVAENRIVHPLFAPASGRALAL